MADDPRTLRLPPGDEPPLLSTNVVGKVYSPDVTAVEDVSVQLRAGRSIGIVGESGSGKTTLLRLLLSLERPSSGQVEYRGRDLAALSVQEQRPYRAAVQAVFQDPRSSLNPRQRVWQIVTEPAAAARSMSRWEQRRLAERLLELVDLPAGHAGRRSARLSTGECQRVAIARAISCDPGVIVLDEPVTSLDASLRGLVLNLLRDLADKENATYVVVSHDVTPVYVLTQHLYVLYRGQVVEEGPTAAVIGSPMHPYTRSLVASIEHPLRGDDDEDRRPDVPGACPFLSRCSEAMDVCATARPRLAPQGDDGHQVRCYLWPQEQPRQAAPGARKGRPRTVATDRGLQG